METLVELKQNKLFCKETYEILELLSNILFHKNCDTPCYFTEDQDGIFTGYEMKWRSCSIIVEKNYLMIMVVKDSKILISTTINLTDDIKKSVSQAADIVSPYLHEHNQ